MRVLGYGGADFSAIVFDDFFECRSWLAECACDDEGFSGDGGVDVFLFCWDGCVVLGYGVDAYFLEFGECVLAGLGAEEVYCFLGCCGS